MFPSWGNYGAPPPQSFGGPGPRKPPIGTGPAPGGFGGYEASSSGSLFSSLQEQHRQQMQQLQMLHQKQLQSVLHHGNSGTGFGGGHSGGFNAAPPWHSEGPGQVEGAESGQSYLVQEKTPVQTPRGPLPPNQGQQPQPPPQQQPAESKPIPPHPESQPPKSQENIGVPVASNTNPCSTNDNTSVPLQDQQNVWYKQHLQNLQKLRQEKAQQNQTVGNAFLTPQPPSQAMPPPLPSEPPKGTPPPPPPREEPPVPPPPPVEVKSANVGNSSNFTDTPDAPKDSEEAARLQQLQAAAAQWQHVQQQRVSLQYQALMQQHEKLQQILEQYQRVVQQPPNLQTMSAELQLRHYEMQHQQFIPLFQNWNSSFALWHEQFQSYPHKDQLQDYELQWKQWQEQMNATNAHLQERVTTITAMVPFASGQYGAMMGQLGQYPGQDTPLQQQVVNPGVQPTVVGAIATAPGATGATAASATGATALGQQPPTFVAHSESSDGPHVQGSLPGGVGVIPPGPLTMQTSSFNSIREPRPSRFDQPPQGFDGPPMFDQSQQRFDGPPRFNPPRQRFEGPTFDQPRQHFDGPTRFDQPLQRFDGPSMFEQPRHRFDGPPRFDQQCPRFDGPQGFDQPRQRFDGPQRFDQPRQRFDGPQRFDQPRQRFDGPQRFDQPRHRFDGPPRFDQPRHRFDNPPRHDQPNFGQQSRLDSLRPLCPPPRFESPSAPQLKQQQGPEPKLETDIQNPASSDSTTLPKTPAQPLSNKDEIIPNKSTADDLTDDNLLGADGFFIQDDPIPQTLRSKKESEEAKNKSVTDDRNKDKPTTSAKDSASVSKPPSPPQNSQKDDGPMTDNKKSIKMTAEIQPELQSSDQLAPKPEPPNLPPGRGRGQPPLRGLGRGQLGPGQYREHNTAQTEEGVGEMPYDYVPSEGDTGIPEEQQDYWQDPSYQGFGEDESEMRPEDTWIPEEHYFEEEEYYEEPVGPYMGRGRPPMRGGPPMGRGRPPMGRGFPPMGRGVPPMGRGGPPMGRGGPPMGRGGPPIGRGGPPMGRGGPPMGRGGPPMGRGGPPMGRGGPPMVRGGPPFSRGGPPMVRGGPPFSRGGPPVGRGGAHMGIGGPAVARGDLDDMHWAEAESAECSEEGEPYWEEWRPQMRGMRPPFPPGRGRPPRGHPGFMPRGRGGPLHPIHGEMGHEAVGHEMELDDANVDQSMHPMYLEHDPYGHPGHPDVGRGRRRIPPPPHEIMDHLEEPLYEGTEEDSEWYPPRGPPMTPHEIIDRGGMRRRPMGRGIARGMWRPGPHREGYEEVYKEDQALDYDRGEDEYRQPPAPEFPPEDYRQEAKFREGEWDRDRPLPEREYPPRMPPPPHLREERWDPETERRRSYSYDENDRARGELRILDYRDEPPYRLDEPPHLRASDWDRPSRRSPLPVRTYPDYGDLRPQYEERKEEPPPGGSATDLPGSSVEAATQGTSGANVLALSQRQHEIILKAAQELKQIRELQEGKTPSTEKLQPASSDLLPELPAGLLGLEIPADVRNVLKGMSAAVQSAAPESASWESKPAVDYQSSLSASAKPTVIPKTVDYGHGHELGATVERIAYGERIVLRPDPVPSDRLYDKEPLGLRDSYSRDPYYDRRPDPYLDRREYSREREMYRDMPPEYDRDRYERERYHSRERDERSPLPPRAAYRDRDKERSGSRDPDDFYGRPVFDRPLYERSGPDRIGPDRIGPDRIGPERYSSPYLERRGYPEDRGPHPAAPLPPPPTPPPPRVEKKPEIKNIDDILKAPGRLSRPERIVIIMRGLPGSGKSHVAKLIRDKEVECGGAPPRVLVLDDYFMTEVEKVEKDPDTGKRVKNKVLEYEYEPEMEDTYRSSMLKTFKKTLDDGFFPFIILDTINDRVKHFEQFWSAAKTKGFEVYVAEITADTQTCAKRNVHGRKLKDITKMSNNWESSPRHMVRLDVRSLLQDAAIEEVEMEDFNPEDVPQETKREEEEESDLGYLPKSKWEMDTSEAKLDKLDGLVSGGKRKRDSEHLSGIEDYLQLPDDYATRTSAPGKKRVRWADLEEQKDADRKRAIGFVVGQTDWEKITDESGQFAQRALNRTKYF